MSKKCEASPRPWKALASTIIKCDDDHWVKASPGNKYPDDTDHANIKFALLAVNAHDDLVSALDDISHGWQSAAYHPSRTTLERTQNRLLHMQHRAAGALAKLEVETADA